MMTAPGALLTREEIAEIIRRLMYNEVSQHLDTDDWEGVSDEQWSYIVDHAVPLMAAALLARLRPAWDELQADRDHWVMEASREGSEAIALRADLETTINQRDRAVEDLRACAEALQQIVADLERDADSSGPEFACKAWDAALTALARQSVQDILRG